MSELGKLRGNVLAVPVISGPIVNAMEVHAGGENVRVARQTESGEIASVASSPQSYAGSVDVGAALKILACGDDVFVFAGAAACAAWSFAEPAAVAYAAAVIDRKHDVAAAGEVLIHSVGIRVVIHVVPAKQHLADGAAVHEDECRFLFLSATGWRKKKLPMNFDAIRSVERHLLRRN